MASGARYDGLAEWYGGFVLETAEEPEGRDLQTRLALDVRT
jgi:hypothetical protein